MAYTDVSWTSGDILTEVKLDNMVANDREPDAMNNGVEMDNTKYIQGADTGATQRNLVGVDANDNMVIGNSNLGNVLMQVPWDGWLDRTAETWTYASATTFTVPTDLTAVFTKGTKVRLQNNDSGTYLYFYVTGSSYGAPNTTVTVVGEDDVPNATLTDNYISYGDNPRGFKRGEDWFRMSAYLSADQTGINSATNVLVELDTETYDTNSNFDTGTHLYTVPITGTYLITWDAEWLGGSILADVEYRSRIREGSTILSEIYGSHSVDISNRNISCAGSLVTPLTKGNTVGLNVYNVDFQSPTLDGGDRYSTYMQIQFIGT